MSGADPFTPEEREAVEEYAKDFLRWFGDNARQRPDLAGQASPEMVLWMGHGYVTAAMIYAEGIELRSGQPLEIRRILGENYSELEKELWR